MKRTEFRPGFELVSPCSFPTTITITPRAPPIDLVSYPAQAEGLVNMMNREYTWMKNDHNSLYKNIYIFLFFCKVLMLLCYVRQTDVVRQDRLLYWPVTSSLDHSTQCYLQDPLCPSSASQPELLNQRPGMGHRPKQMYSQWLQAGFDSGLYGHQLTQLPWASGYIIS